MANNSYKTLAEILEKNRKKYDLELISRAYKIAEAAHSGQKRHSGEPYINHTVATAITLAEFGADTATISAGLLHDVPEDTAITLEQIEKEFGKEIAFLVEGVTKLGKIRYPKHAEETATGAQALYIENLRKMFFATAKDIRVILIKLADRLHNMNTLQFIPKEKQKRIALETLEIYAPVAHRLGMGHIKGELEDLAFPIIQPEEFSNLQKKLSAILSERKIELKSFEKIIKKILTHDHIPSVNIHGRIKHMWSLWKKLNKPEYGNDLNKIYDLLAIRIIVPKVGDIYAAMGSIHQHYRPLTGLVKDYLATPKPNGYRSLHSTVFGPQKRPVEIQIRTEEMHRDAEFGIAAHWVYAESDKPKEGAKLNSHHLLWLKQLEDWQKKIKGPEDFWENLKIDFFQNRIFALTPKGDVLDLPEGATPIDFAYSVHSALGHRMTGVLINNKISPITTKLKNGDIIEIMASKKPAGPKQDWINFTKTAIARHAIHQWFQAQSKDKHKILGKKSLELELLGAKLPAPDSWTQAQIVKVCEKFHCKDLNGLYVGAGRADINPRTVIKTLFPEIFEEEVRKKKRTPAFIPKKTDELLITKAKCCKPQESDNVAGYISGAARGIIAHQDHCKNIRRNKNISQILRLGWRGADLKIITPITISICGKNRVGLLNDITALLAKENINIEDINVAQIKDKIAKIAISLGIADLDELQNLTSLIRQIPDVRDAKRE